MQEDELPAGVRLTQLQTHRDARGSLTEVWRLAWHDSPAPLQWNAVASDANVLRGVHVHKKHWDYVFLVSGDMRLGLHDMRTESPSYRKSSLVRMSGPQLSFVVIPPGVAHGFYYTAPTVQLYAISRYWDGSDEFGCRWDAPELDIAWPCTEPVLSARDHEPMSYAQLREAFAAG